MGHHDTIKVSSHKIVRNLSVFLTGLVVWIAVAGTAHAAELQVPIDESKAFALEKAVATVSVTNPSIADVSVHNNKIILVIGRTFGTTNIIALDSDGNPVATKRVRVVSPAGTGNVTYVRGPGIFSYSCSPRCERVILPGDRDRLQAPDIGPATEGEVAQQSTIRDGRARTASD